MFYNTFSIAHAISEAVVGTAKDGQPKGMLGSIVDVGMDNDEEQQMPPMIDTELDLKATLVVVPANLILQWREQLTICVHSQSSCQVQPLRTTSGLLQVLQEQGLLGLVKAHCRTSMHTILNSCKERSTICIYDDCFVIHIDFHQIHLSVLIVYTIHTSYSMTAEVPSMQIRAVFLSNPGIWEYHTQHLHTTWSGGSRISIWLEFAIVYGICTAEQLREWSWRATQ